MAFGFGVSDIIELTRIIVTAIANIHDAPTELQELAERVELVELNLQSISKLPSNAAAGNTQNIIRLVKGISEVLGKIRDVVIKYGNNDGWRNAFSRAKYGIWEKGGVGDLVAKLEQRTRDLTDSLVIQILLVTNQMRQQIDQIFTSARQEDERIRNQRPAQDTNAAHHHDSSGSFNNTIPASNQIDVVQSVLERVLHSEQPSNVGLQPDREDLSIEREIEIQLGQAGIEAKFTRALIDVINKQRKRLAHPEDIDPISYIGGKNRLETPKGWIMVVDGFNEGKITNLDLVSEALLLTWLKCGPSLPRLISSSFESGRSTIVANGSSIGSSQQVFKLRPSSLDELRNLTRSRW